MTTFNYNLRAGRNKKLKEGEVIKHKNGSFVLETMERKVADLKKYGTFNGCLHTLIDVTTQEGLEQIKLVLPNQKSLIVLINKTDNGENLIHFKYDTKNETAELTSWNPNGAGCIDLTSDASTYSLFFHDNDEEAKKEVTTLDKSTLFKDKEDVLLDADNLEPVAGDFNSGMHTFILKLPNKQFVTLCPIPEYTATKSQTGSIEIKVFNKQPKSTMVAHGSNESVVAEVFYTIKYNYDYYTKKDTQVI